MADTQKINPAERMALAVCPSYRETTGTIVAQNTGIPSMPVLPGFFSGFLTGTWTATVHAQFQPSGSSSWYDLDSFTTSTAINLSVWASGSVRTFVKTGAYTLGTITSWLGQGA